MSKGRILIIVEGSRIDLRLMTHLLDIYDIAEQYQIVSYNTNIYALYNSMFKNTDPADIDILEHLKEHESDQAKKQIFNERYSDILLVFDFDPQDPQFSVEKIMEMAEYFVESTDMGKLYLNYPMVESFYHMKSIPDSEYNSYTASMAELESGVYKQRVNTVNRNRDYRKFAVDRIECNIVIKQNIEKARIVIEKYTRSTPSYNTDYLILDSIDILSGQIKKMLAESEVAVLCTCVFYIIDYNPKLIRSEHHP